VYWEQVNEPKESHKSARYTYFGDSPYLGFELELDRKLPNNDEFFNENLAKILLTSPYRDHYLVEKDNSLYVGCELITHPHSINDMRSFLDQEMKDLLMQLNTNLGPCNSDKAGFHVHVSKKLFGDTQEELVENVAKLWFMFSHNSRAIIFLGGNKANLDYTVFPGHTFSKDEAIDKVREELTNPMRLFRYQAINVQPIDTIEFRFFKSSTKIEDIKNYIELIWFLSNRSKEIPWDNAWSLQAWFEPAPEHLESLNNFKYLRK
jgi:hypothetical protein